MKTVTPQVYGCYVWKVPGKVDIDKLDTVPLPNWQLIYRVTGDDTFTLDKCKELYQRYGPSADKVVIGCAKGDKIEVEYMEVR